MSVDLYNPMLGDIEIMQEDEVQIDIANDRIKYVGQLFETAAAIMERPSISITSELQRESDIKDVEESTNGITPQFNKQSLDPNFENP